MIGLFVLSNRDRRTTFIISFIRPNRLVTMAAQTQIDTTDTAFALAQTLRDNGYNSEALIIAKLDIELKGIHIYKFSLWTQNFAMKSEDRSLALTAGIIASRTKPSLKSAWLIYPNTKLLNGQPIDRN
jgi:hypothetical protein